MQVFIDGGISLAVHLRRHRSHLYLRAGASVAGFIVDFYCHKSALVVEIDGDIHNIQKEDTNREQALSELGLRVVHFRNDEILKSLSKVIEKIKGSVSISK